MENTTVTANETIENQSELAFWKEVNRNSCEFESIIGAGAWMEADKLDEMYSDD